MFWQLCLQIHCLFKSCTTLFAYVSLNDFPMEIFFCMCCHMCLQMTSLCKSCTTLLAYVSLDDHFREILPHTPWAKKYVLLLYRWLLYVNPAPHSMHMSLKMTTSGKYCPTLLAIFFFFFFFLSGICCHMCLQMTSLCKSCTTLFAA